VVAVPAEVTLDTRISDDDVEVDVQLTARTKSVPFNVAGIAIVLAVDDVEVTL
jgi:hypothetical protein